ncbi:MAG TPA: hypothetical protein VH301_02365 [Usitatibacter sp.]|jgi:hypothetical protein|nr:hypothetical protein [Usitatibacter sp.]
MKRAVFVNTHDDLSLDELTLFSNLGYDTVVIALDAGLELVRHAADQFDIDLDASWLVGRTRDEIEVGVGAGCGTILLDRMGHDPLTRAIPDLIAANFADAAAKIVRAAESRPSFS